MVLKLVKATRTVPGDKKAMPFFLLMNIIFSNEFADEFGGAGDTPSGAEIDSGDAGNNRGFWI